MARSLRCPRCSTIVTVADGQTPVCPGCGFGASPPAAPSPAAPGAAAPSRMAPLSPPPAQPAFGYGQPPAAGNAAPSPQQPIPRPGSVTFLAVLGYVTGGFYALLGLLMLLGGAAFGSLLTEYANSSGEEVPAGAFAIVFAIVGIILLGVAALQFVIATGILRGRNWARITQLVFSFIGLATGLFGVLTMNPVAVVVFALNIATVVILFSRNAKAYFTQPRPLAT